MSTDKNNNSDEFDKTAQSLSGTYVFKFTPDLFSGDSTNEKSRPQCITSTKEFNKKSVEKLQPKIVKYSLEEPKEQTIGLFSRSSESLGFIDPNKPTTSALFTQPLSSMLDGNNKTSPCNPTPTSSTITVGLFSSTTAQSLGETATSQPSFGSNDLQPASTPLFGSKKNASRSVKPNNTSTKELNEKSFEKLQLKDDEAGLEEPETPRNGLFSRSNESLGFIDQNKPKTSVLFSQPASRTSGENDKTSPCNPSLTPSTTTGGLLSSTTAQASGETATSQPSFGIDDLQPANKPSEQNEKKSILSSSLLSASNPTSISQPTRYCCGLRFNTFDGKAPTEQQQQSAQFGPWNTDNSLFKFSNNPLPIPQTKPAFGITSFNDSKKTPEEETDGLKEQEDQTNGLFSTSSESLGFIDPNEPTTSTLFSQPASITSGENNKTSLGNPTPSTTTGGLFGSRTAQSFGETATSQPSFGSNDLQPASTPSFGLEKNANGSVTPIIQPAGFGCGVSFNSFDWKASTEQQLQQQPTQFGPTNNNNSISKFSYNPLSIPQTKPAFGITSFSDSKYRTEARGESIKSSTFTSGQGSECEHHWRFDIYPNGYYDSSMDFVGLKINLLDDKRPDNVQVTMKISILNSYDNPVHTVGKNAMTITIPETGIIYCPNFLNKQEIINNSSCILSNGNLKILFEIGTLIGTSTKSKKIKQAYSPKDQLRDQIFKYFNSEKLSDVVIEVDESEIKAHKLILSTQSPIFAAMFDEEINKNRIKIDDMKLDVAKQLLEFIYTNKKPTRINEFTTELIIAAQKYQIAELRIMCEEILLDSLSFDNAIKILLLAHKHDINKLKDFVIEFIQANGSILKSNEFKDLENEHPALAMEVYRLIAIEKAVN
ncbi:flocculation protein FLO11-like [Aphidius gifuensis]|uniref:flocculation protein FLO11-like n=1 Tax=Aphidius gifuensis TaxID=684658 RepID=UPI001CDCE885|nr:flocculation protein FLO11-like [Aphidius gifuensis]